MCRGPGFFLPPQSYSDTFPFNLPFLPSSSSFNLLSPLILHTPVFFPIPLFLSTTLTDCTAVDVCFSQDLCRLLPSKSCLFQKKILTGVVLRTEIRERIFKLAAQPSAFYKVIVLLQVCACVRVCVCVRVHVCVHVETECSKSVILKVL